MDREALLWRRLLARRPGGHAQPLWVRPLHHWAHTGELWRRQLV